MNMKNLSTTSLIAFVLCASVPVFSAEGPTKKEMKNEERMRDEKRHDEESAKDWANRVKVARFDSVWRQPRTNDIDMFQAREVVPKPFKSVALLTYDCPAKEEAQAVAALIAKAKDLGTDGILMLAFEEPAFKRVDIFSPDDRRIFRANAIIYHSPK